VLIDAETLVRLIFCFRREAKKCAVFVPHNPTFFATIVCIAIRHPFIPRKLMI